MDDEEEEDKTQQNGKEEGQRKRRRRRRRMKRDRGTIRHSSDFQILLPLDTGSHMTPSNLKGNQDG